MSNHVFLDEFGHFTRVKLSEGSEPFTVDTPVSGDLTLHAHWSSIAVVAEITASPAAGNYTTSQSVTLTIATEGAAIYYTLDGSTHTPGSLAYSGPITISETATLKAITVKSGIIDSGILIAAYVITTYEVGDTGPAGGIVFYERRNRIESILHA